MSLSSFLSRRLAGYWTFKFLVVTLLYEHRLDGLEVEAGPQNLEIRALTPETISSLEGAWPFRPGEVRERLLTGQGCYVGLIDGRIAHFSWVQTADAHEIATAGRSSVIRDGELWIYHCRTFDWARRKGVYEAVLHKILRDHRQRGFQRALIYTTADNVASQRGILRAGFKPVANFRALEVGPWTLAWPSGRGPPLQNG
jgi:hypothetical protein